MEVKIFDGVLPKKLEDDIENFTMGINFPWFYIPDITRMVSGSELYAQPGFHNTAYNLYQPTNPFFDYFKFLCFFIEEKIGYDKELFLFRLRCGLNFPLVNHNKKFDMEYNYPHIDHNPDLIQGNTFTCLYYVNDCDGDTFIFNETEESKHYTVKQRVSPKKGRICIFDGKYYHASSSPTLSNSRVVLTFNYHDKKYHT
jgi:hypothetical protein